MDTVVEHISDPWCLSAASPQLPGQQQNTGQSSRGAGDAGVRHHQRQNQTTGGSEDQDPGRPAGVYVRTRTRTVQNQNNTEQNQYRTEPEPEQSQFNTTLRFI